MTFLAWSCTRENGNSKVNPDWTSDGLSNAISSEFYEYRDDFHEFAIVISRKLWGVLRVSNRRESLPAKRTKKTMTII